jgi:hypothetical protein
VVARDLGVITDKGGLVVGLGENLKAGDGFGVGGRLDRRGAEDAEEEEEKEIFATDERGWTQMKRSRLLSVCICVHLRLIIFIASPG